MDPTLVVFGIQAILRAAQAGADLFGEHARDRKVFLPNLKLPPGTRSTQLQWFLTENPELAGNVPELSAIWDPDRKALKPGISEDQMDTALASMLEHEASIQLQKEGKKANDAEREAKMLAGGRMVEQWREERKPPNAGIRMALTLTDIGLEFAASNPSILGVGSRGEKLIVAFANNTSALIPSDVSAFGAKADFADRVLGIFLRAGLGTIAGNAATVFKNEDIAKLVAGVTKPIVDKLPTDLVEQIRYRDLVDTLAGPAAEAAFSLLAENTETYLGKDFADDKALGAVTSALFESIKQTTQESNIVNVFSEQGLIRLYQAGLGVAVERPGLFIGDDDSVHQTLFEELLSGTAATLHANPRFEGPIGASLAAMAVETVGRNAPALLNLNPNEPWEKVAVTALDQVTTGFAEAFKDLDDNGMPKGAFKLFNDEQLVELGRVVLEQMAQTPGMLGIHRSEVQAIVAGMAEAMAADDNLLLSGDEWINIAGVAAQKAASNPGRLFGLSADDQGRALAVTVITSVLKVAGDSWTADGRKDRPLLFGETLEAALESVVEGLAGNITEVARSPEVVDQFLQQLLADAADNPDKYGSDGLLTIFRTFIGEVLASGTLPTEDQINTALTG